MSQLVALWAWLTVNHERAWSVISELMAEFMGAKKQVLTHVSWRELIRCEP